MPGLSPRQSRRRRLVLIGIGFGCLAALVGTLIIPAWDAGAGGLERGEKAQAPSGSERRRDPRPRRNEPGPDPGTTARPDAPDAARVGRDAPPARADDTPVAVPVPRDAARNSRIQQSAPTARTGEPTRVPLPSLPPPDPKLSELPTATPGVEFAALRAVFRRPAASLRGASAEITALGARLFAEKKLSADHRMSCATCHDPALSFADGRRKARGNTGKDLPRNTPSLWNLGDARAFYWDGRAPTLEAQIKDAVEREGEMDATLEAAVVWLRRDPEYVAAFARAFGGADALSGENILKAIAAYERTLISPATRFDRWVDGDPYALTERETAGFRLFTGKARCLACHGGWRFTDDLFHDVGLRSRDPGRQGVAPGGPERAFKTPSLREAVWSAPYMHDGSLKSLEDVVDHYAGKLEQRASLAPELKRGITLSESERADLIAFLRTLSSDRSPRAP